MVGAEEKKSPDYGTKPPLRFSGKREAREGEIPATNEMRGGERECTDLQRKRKEGSEAYETERIRLDQRGHTIPSACLVKGGYLSKRKNLQGEKPWRLEREKYMIRSNGKSPGEGRGSFIGRKKEGGLSSLGGACPPSRRFRKGGEGGRISKQRGKTPLFQKKRLCLQRGWTYSPNKGGTLPRGSSVREMPEGPKVIRWEKEGFFPRGAPRSEKKSRVDPHAEKKGDSLHSSCARVEKEEGRGYRQHETVSVSKSRPPRQ